ncbi:MAG: hypothetical protein Q8922_04030 [Bacteroidota bacterium]|nr:hypothetical protein [Bacteroidota bacterium]MDP4233463.1 hypothetical protein [Bacteroidota bacterium]MDP4242329.1 hypothetical protein [Bacteroidota bacterium]MDP4287085.1 hypothetical protein [Bacteroidota bacterium]
MALPASKLAVRSVTELLASQEATRFFLRQYYRLTFALVAVATVLMYFLATPAFMQACYFGMAFPIVTSFVSFLITEWAFEQPNMIFFTVAIMSVIVRMFNLLIAFCVGYLILKMNGAGVIIGLLATYFSYLVIEIAYIHNKGKLLGQ